MRDPVSLLRYTQYKRQGRTTLQKCIVNPPYQKKDQNGENRRAESQTLKNS